MTSSHTAYLKQYIFCRVSLGKDPSQEVHLNMSLFQTSPKRPFQSLKNFEDVSTVTVSGNSQSSSQIGICLTLPNLGFLWVFFKYPKISKIGNPLFFPVIYKANEKLSKPWLYYTVREHSRHSRTLKKIINVQITHLRPVFSLFTLCSQMPVVFIKV